MSNLTTTASMKHLAETLKKAKSNNASLYLYYGNFADYTHIDNRNTIDNMRIEAEHLIVPMVTNRGHELFVKRYPLQGLYIALQRRSQRHLVDSKSVLAKAITRVMNSDDDIFFNTNNLEHAFKYATDDMPSNYLFNDPCTASFLPANKPLLFLENGEKYQRSHQQIKIGKAVRSICNDVLNMGLNDSNVEAITNKVKAEFAPIEIFTSDNISEVYAMNIGTRSECGTLSESCMRNKSYLYDGLTDSENCRVLYAVNCDGELIARALLWETITQRVVMDRVYGTDSNIEKFKQYAIQQGYYHKYEQNYSNTAEFVNPSSGETETLYMTIDVSEIDLSSAPFLDTFYYYSYDGASYSLSNESDSETTHTFRETDGSAAEY